MSYNILEESEAIPQGNIDHCKASYPHVRTNTIAFHSVKPTSKSNISTNELNYL